MTTRKTKKSTRKEPARKSSKSTTRARRPRAAGPANAKGLKVRMYRVGFGDFFLVTVPTSSGNQYILIDCGVFKGTTGKGDIGSIVDAVEDMYKTTKGHLALVIMTHRHADHIAGFSKAPRFQDFTASMVWMPYWEQFNDDKNSANSLQFGIEALAENLALQFRGRPDPEAQEALAQLANATGIEDFNAVAKNGKKKGGGNAAALDLLKNHLGQNGKNVRYYAANDKAELPEELEGLTATILGPPPQKSRAFLTLMDLKKGVGQYLDSMNDAEEGKPAVIQPFPSEWDAEKKPIPKYQKEFPEGYPPVDSRDKPIDYDRFTQDVDNAQPDMLVAAAGKIENFLNNQSLVVLFEFGGKRLLFAGDAQGGNWEYWLFNTDEPQKDPTKAGNIIEKSKELLQSIDFYKVGHHGSTNATPIQAVECAVGRPDPKKGFISMCSTQTGVYGNPKKGTEVPRDPLMEALGKDSCLVRSDAIDIKLSDGTVVKANKKVKVPDTKLGTIKKGNLYIEYSF